MSENNKQTDYNKQRQNDIRNLKQIIKILDNPYLTILGPKRFRIEYLETLRRAIKGLEGGHHENSRTGQHRTPEGDKKIPMP